MPLLDRGSSTCRSGREVRPLVHAHGNPLSRRIAQSSIWHGSLAVLDCLRLLPRILNDTANGRLRGVRKLLGRLTTEVPERTEEKTHRERERETILKKSEPLSPHCELCALCGESS